MNNTWISVNDPLNIWPQNNKQILYYLTQFYQTPVFLKNKKPTLSVSTIVKTQIILFPPQTTIELQNVISPKKDVYLKLESNFVYPPA